MPAPAGIPSLRSKCFMAIFNTASRAETVALGERLAGRLAPGSLVLSLIHI